MAGGASLLAGLHAGRAADPTDLFAGVSGHLDDVRLTYAAARSLHDRCRQFRPRFVQRGLGSPVRLCGVLKSLHSEMVAHPGWPINEANCVDDSPPCRPQYVASACGVLPPDTDHTGV